MQQVKGCRQWKSDTLRFIHLVATDWIMKEFQGIICIISKWVTVNWQRCVCASYNRDEAARLLLPHIVFSQYLEQEHMGLEGTFEVANLKWADVSFLLKMVHTGSNKPKSYLCCCCSCRETAVWFISRKWSLVLFWWTDCTEIKSCCDLWP